MYYYRKILSIPHKFEHSVLPKSISKQNKNHWARNNKRYSHNFYSMIYTKTCSKCLGSGPQRPKIPKNDHFRYVPALLHIDQDHKAKWKQLGTQVFVTFLSFHTVLICSYICPKLWRKESKRLRIIKLEHFS